MGPTKTVRGLLFPAHPKHSLLTHTSHTTLLLLTPQTPPPPPTPPSIPLLWTRTPRRRHLSFPNFNHQPTPPASTASSRPISTLSLISSHPPPPLLPPPKGQRNLQNVNLQMISLLSNLQMISLLSGPSPNSSYLSYTTPSLSSPSVSASLLNSHKIPPSNCLIATAYASIAST